MTRETAEKIKGIIVIVCMTLFTFGPDPAHSTEIIISTNTKTPSTNDGFSPNYQPQPLYTIAVLNPYGVAGVPFGSSCALHPEGVSVRMLADDSDAIMLYTAPVRFDGIVIGCPTGTLYFADSREPLQLKIAQE